MSVEVGPGISIVIKKTSLRRRDIELRDVIGRVGDLVAEDADLLVLGPLFDSDEGVKKLEDLGLSYFEDFFDIPHSGGPVADWCQITLRLRE